MKTEKYIQYSWDEWEKKYEPIPLPNQEDYYLFDTHNEDDLKFIKEFEKNNSVLNIWTVVDGDNGELYIDSGWRRVNRFGYMITKNPREFYDVIVQAEY
tara:strand:+ start:224 stop:520 length:297 start_codon:yes stop_codon:yes gene_type:complete